MKIFVATNKGFKKRKSDILFCRENELVMFGLNYKNMIGMDTLNLTSAFKVIHTRLTPSDIRRRFRKAEVKMGWNQVMNKSDFDADIIEETEILLLLAKEFPTGVILERERGKIEQRI